jgi:hypothetical protein
MSMQWVVWNLTTASLCSSMIVLHGAGGLIGVDITEFTAIHNPHLINLHIEFDEHHALEDAERIFKLEFDPYEASYYD